jgi:hypothetical protein
MALRVVCNDSLVASKQKAVAILLSYCHLLLSCETYLLSAIYGVYDNKTTKSHQTFLYVSVHNMSLPPEGKDDVRRIVGGREEGRDLLVGEAGYAATYARDEEDELRMGLGEGDELIDVGLDGLYAPLHRGDGVTLALKSDSLAPDGAKLAIGGIGCSASMSACEVAAKYEDLVGL